VPSYATIVGLLQAIVTLRKWDERTWGEQQETAFANLRQALLAAPVVSTPDFTRPFHISTDASQYGVGGVLYQVVGGERKYVAFCSKSLKKGQRNYPATKRELLAIIFCLKRWEPFLKGQHFSVETDHKALTYMHTAKSHMLLDWASYLASFTFTVKHTPGVLNVLPHYLSHLNGMLDEQQEEWPEEAVIAATDLLRRAGDRQRPQQGEDHLDKEATLEVDDNPVWNLRNTEKMFTEVVLECEWVEDFKTRDELVAGVHAKSHQGAMGTFQELLRKGKFWSDMKRDCRRATQSCRKCLCHNIGRSGCHPLKPSATLIPMMKVNVDLLGPCMTSEGSQYILVIIDAASRYVWLRALDQPTAECIAREMLKIFAEFGWPSVVVTDGGRNISQAQVANLLKAVGAEARVTVPEAHEQNSAVERVIREVRQLINKKCEADPKGWRKHLPMFQSSLNDRVSDRTKSTPFSLMFARQRGPYPMEGDEEVDEEYLEKVREDMIQIVYPKVQEVAREASEKACQEADDNRPVTDTVFKPGELVMVANSRRSKQQSRYEGPFRVEKFDPSKSAYILLDMDGKRLSGVGIKHGMLKRFKGELSGIEEGEEGRFRVTTIKDVRDTMHGREYLVKWTGYKELVWAPDANLDGAVWLLELCWNTRDADDAVKHRPGRVGRVR
jgi:hypothetical protein